MRWVKQLLAVLILSVALASTSLAAGIEGMTPAGAVRLGSVASGRIIGNGGGAFTYYTFDYPGDGSTGTLTVDYTTTELTTIGAFGANLYQNGARIAALTGVGPRPGTSNVSFYSNVAGPVLVQVYNYAPSVVSYELRLAGVKPPAAVAPPTATPMPPLGASGNPLAAPRRLSGVLRGNSAGSYVYYTFDYPGDGSVQTIALDIPPYGTHVARAVVLSVFQEGVLLAEDDASHADTPGHLVLSFSSTKAGPILVQLGNYNTRTTIDYAINR